jgi:hypothetical protein
MNCSKKLFYLSWIHGWPLPRSILILDNAKIHIYPELSYSHLCTELVIDSISLQFIIHFLGWIQCICFQNNPMSNSVADIPFKYAISINILHTDVGAAVLEWFIKILFIVNLLRILNHIEQMRTRYSTFQNWTIACL